jgi:hypothetical protein
MAALAYNLKKYLKFVTKKAKSKAIAIQVEVETVFSTYFSAFWLIFRQCKLINFEVRKLAIKNSILL